MSAEERTKQAAFHFAKDRLRYLLTRGLARYALSRYLPLPPESWRFQSNAYGRPVIGNAPRDARWLTFNLSHTDEIIAMAIGRHLALGVDIERAHADAPLSIADSFFAKAEARQLRDLPDSLRSRRFYELWTLKECYVKAKGAGLSIPLDKFSFDLDRTDEVGIRFDPALADAPSRWLFWQWHLSPDHIAALCVERPAERACRVRQWQSVPFRHYCEVPFQTERASAAASRPRSDSGSACALSALAHQETGQ
ncbi:4'-phosphopantetheinyl transferase family protein [Chromobacterium alticapitis]|nr:4'-phosphopantetheinyl transferase superfamily protein [Chromobacterium alticapitis]